MLSNENIAERTFYTNSGYFVIFLAAKYGIDIINQLFTLYKDEIIAKMEDIGGLKFPDLETEYLITARQYVVKYLKKFL